MQQVRDTVELEMIWMIKISIIIRFSKIS